MSKGTTLEASITSRSGVGSAFAWSIVGSLRTRCLVVGALRLPRILSRGPLALVLSLIPGLITRARLIALIVVEARTIVAALGEILPLPLLVLLIIHLATLIFQNQRPIHHLLEARIGDVGHNIGQSIIEAIQKLLLLILISFHFPWCISRQLSEFVVVLTDGHGSLL